MAFFATVHKTAHSPALFQFQHMHSFTAEERSPLPQGCDNATAPR